MKKEFGSPEGTRSYYMVRKVQDAGRRKQLVWLMERMFFIVKTTYMSRDNYGLIAAAELGEKVNWAYLLHNRFHSEIFGSDKRKQGGSKIAPMLSLLFEHARQNVLALKLSSMKATPVVKATMVGKKEKKVDVDSEDSDEPPSNKKKPRIDEEASGSLMFPCSAQVEDKVLSEMLKLGFAECDVQNAVKQTWSDINMKLEETPLRPISAKDSKDKGKAMLKVSKKKLMFSRDNSESSKFQKDDVKNVKLVDSLIGRKDSKFPVKRDATLYQPHDIDIAIQHLNETIMHMKDFAVQVDVLEQKKMEFERKSAHSVKHDVLSAQINQIRMSVLKDLELKGKEAENVSTQLQEAQSKFQTIREWMDELKEQFFSELNNVSDKNAELQSENIVLHNRLEVLKSVEQQLLESVEDIEVEGTFITSSDLMQLSADLTVKSQNLWDNIKSRMMPVMQRPYQMFSMKEVSGDESRTSN